VGDDGMHRPAGAAGNGSDELVGPQSLHEFDDVLFAVAIERTDVGGGPVEGGSGQAGRMGWHRRGPYRPIAARVTTGSPSVCVSRALTVGRR
jgi:hypothetical protein